MTNMVPALTFVLAWILRYHSINFHVTGGLITQKNHIFVYIIYYYQVYIHACSKYMQLNLVNLCCTTSLEQVNIRRLHSQAKIAGTIVIVGGAMIMTLVKGPTIVLPWTKADTNVNSPSVTHPQNPIKGALMLSAGCFCWACFYILQVRVNLGKHFIKKTYANIFR